MGSNLKVGYKVKFDEDKRFNWTVRSTRGDYAILTATLGGRGYYTIIDFKHKVRSAGTSWGLGAQTQKDVEGMMLALFGEHPDGITQELSNRHKRPLLISAIKKPQMSKAERLIDRLGVDKVGDVVVNAHHEANYYVDAWTDNFGGVHGFYTDKCIVGAHNPNTHYKLSELRAAVNAIRKQNNC